MVEESGGAVTAGGLGPLVVSSDEERAEEAGRLARRLGVSLLAASEGLPPEAAAGADALVLRLDGRGLALAGDGMELRADLSRMVPRLRPDRLSRELLVRAARVRAPEGAGRPAAVDATAGFGEDALLLAAAGFEVTLYERDPVICALAADGLARAALDPALAGAVSRMRLVAGDSVAALRGMGEAGERPDVVLLDPMFPERRKSAAVKKKFQLLHRLESPCDDEAGLLGAALAAGPRKVVVKRPAKGPAFAGVRPGYSMAGKAVRYDVIVPPRP